MSRKDTPGAGLGGVLKDDSVPDVEEEPETRRECKHCGSPLERCPACKGTTFEELEPIAGGGDNTKYGEYRWTKCSWCDGEAFVSQSKADRWRLQQRSEPPPAR